MTFTLTTFLTTTLILYAFHAIFTLKLSDYLQLIPSHTDVITLTSFTGLFSKLIAVACFNFMTLAGELETNDGFYTSFLNLYAGMLKTPFIGSKLNYILPGCMLILSAGFTVISVLGYESKAVKALKNGKVAQGEVRTQLETVYKGEICILKEIQGRNNSKF